MTTLERRFRTKLRNYEIKFSCETKEFERRETELRAALDAFIELPPEVKNDMTFVPVDTLEDVLKVALPQTVHAR